MADVNVLLTCAGQRVDIVRAFQAALRGGAHRGRVLVSDLDPLSPSLFAADEVVDLPPVDDPGYGAAVAEVCRREGVRAVLPLTDLDPVLLAEAAGAIREAGAHVFLPDARGRARLPGQVGVPPDARPPRAALAPHLAARRGRPRRPALPGAPEAAPRLRRAPHLPVRRSPDELAFFRALQPGRERRAAGPARASSSASTASATSTGRRSAPCRGR